MYPRIPVATSSHDFFTFVPMDILPSDVSWKKSPYGFDESDVLDVLRKLSPGVATSGVVVDSLGIVIDLYESSIPKKNFSCKFSHEKSLAVYNFRVFILSPG